MMCSLKHTFHVIKFYRTSSSYVVTNIIITRGLYDH